VATAGKVMSKLGIPVMGLQQFDSYAGNIRRYFDRTAPDEFLKDPVLGPQWTQALKDANGDELAARDALYNKAFDAGSAVANAAAGMLGGAALGHRLGISAIPNRWMRGAIGGLEGAGIGAGMGAAGAYGQQTERVNLGYQPQTSTETILRGAAEGAIPMAIMTGPSHLVVGGGLTPEQQMAMEYGRPGAPVSQPPTPTTPMQAVDIGMGYRRPAITD